MPSFLSFGTAKSPHTLFEIRLENDFIVFRGSQHESAGQLLKGTLVLCLAHPLKIEDIHLRLTGTLSLGWTDSKITSTGLSNHPVNKTSIIYSHRWAPFAGVGSPDPVSSNTLATQTKGTVLQAGNYEWPFELMLPGDMTESIEGLREAAITYKLKATIARGLLSSDSHVYKRLRIIRTLDPSALEFLHAMSVENIWPNKVEYSIVSPQKAVVFGSTIPLETRFTPLLKGIEIGEVTVKLIESHDVSVKTNAHSHKEHKKERELMVWSVPMTREEHWQDMIENTGQEGWVMTTALALPKKLGKCVQDVNTYGIKVRHKLKLVVTLKNPDGHMSELRATLPLTIFISPNMPLDEDGNLVQQGPGSPTSTTEAVGAIAPPGYGEHILDQLYDEAEASGLQTPHHQSGMSTPSFGHSRAGSSDNLAAMLHGGVPPGALVTRLQNLNLDASRRSNSYGSLNGLAASGNHLGGNSPRLPADSGTHPSPPFTAPISRTNSHEHDEGLSRAPSPEHIEISLEELSKVPSYQTAVKTPVRSQSYDELFMLPNYQTATSAPSSPVTGHIEAFSGHVATHSESLETIDELPQEPSTGSRDGTGSSPARRPGARRRQTHMGFSFMHTHHHFPTDSEERRRVLLMQARERVA